MAAPPPPAVGRPASSNSGTYFFGSQIGGGSVINYSYTDMPWKLLAWDAYYFFKFFWAVPYLVWPFYPADSAELSELSPTRENVFCIVVHAVLCVVQLAGLVALPGLALLPGWAAGLLVTLFLLFNHALCWMLNSKDVEYHSDPKYAPILPQHAHEQWIYINGVAAGKHWMQSNLDRLATTFKRPILGIHNKTSGILFDFIECIIQRNLGYATKDVRVCYQIIKQKLYSPQYSKIVFILHSQGAIEGSLILDWLLQEMPQDLLCKLEVYTFGNAANHFNNPHRHIRSQSFAKQNPLAASIDLTQLASDRATAMAPTLRQPGSEPKNRRRSARSADAELSSSTATTTTTTTVAPISTSATSPHPDHLSGRAIGHIEHYAHTTDFVALLGVLHFVTPSPSSRIIPRFIGRVFVRKSPRGGHQMVQHYLDGMFPLQRDPDTGMLLRGQNGVPVGVVEDGENQFMESEIWIAGDGERGPGSEGDSGNEVKVELKVEVFGLSPVLGRHQWDWEKRKEEGGIRVKVKEMSRLWQYRNGRIPEETPPVLIKAPDGVVRDATI